MSRVGKLPISVPAKVEITLAANEITVKGPLGTLKQAASSDVIVKKDGADLTEQGVTDYLASVVAKWWLPDEVLFVDSLPRNPAGKMLKTVLKREYASA